jgi:hypothetical protein
MINDASSRERNDLHNSIDNSFNKILKNLDFIFQSMTFNTHQQLEDTNDLEIASSMSNISSEIHSLLKIINSLKVKHIKTFELHNEHNEEEFKRNFTEKLRKLDEISKKISLSVKKWKEEKDYYIMCLKILPKK